MAYEPRLLCHVSRFYWGWGGLQFADEIIPKKAFPVAICHPEHASTRTHIHPTWNWKQFRSCCSSSPMPTLSLRAWAFMVMLFWIFWGGREIYASCLYIISYWLTCYINDIELCSPWAGCAHQPQSTAQRPVRILAHGETAESLWEWKQFRTPPQTAHPPPRLHFLYQTEQFDCAPDEDWRGGGVGEANCLKKGGVVIGTRTEKGYAKSGQTLRIQNRATGIARIWI